MVHLRTHAGATLLWSIILFVVTVVKMVWYAHYLAALGR